MTETGAIPSPAELADRSAIEDVIYTHSRGVDRADAAILKSAYWPDAEVAYGSFNGPAHEFCDLLAAGIRRYRATHHQVSNISARVSAENAVVESYVTAYHYLDASETNPGTDTEMTYFGRYVDHMQQRNRVWKLLFRQVVMDWNQNLKTSADFGGPTFAGLARSDRHPNDPLYAMLERVFNTPGDTA